MCVITFLFLWKGDRIRAGSQFCTYLKEKKEREATRGREGPTDEVVEEKV